MYTTASALLACRLHRVELLGDGNSKFGMHPAGRLPLYFQHQGHSRTIVGIQRTASGTASDDYSLLLLDPGTPASTLHNALSQQRGWQVTNSIPCFRREE